MTGWQVLWVAVAGPEATPLPEFARPTVLVFPADAEGEALAGSIAAASGGAVLGRISGLAQKDGELVATRASHGGRIAITVRPVGQLAVATANVRPPCDGEIALGAPSAVEVARAEKPDQRIALESASIVLGGGRGLDEAGFAQLDRLADLLGGAVGASLPATDLGLAPVSRQVGQSGKFVTPTFYLAAGLSGTPQHLAGIGSATRLLAINSDPEAAIFRYAEAGAVADAGILLSALVEAVSRRLEAAS